MARGKKPDWMIEIAQERMDILFNRAEKEYKEHPERSHRYVELARKISNVKIVTSFWFPVTTALSG